MRFFALAAAAILVAAPPAWAGKGVEGVVNLNTAPVEILALLPGIGPAKASAVVAYRSRRPFRTVDELVRIKGLGRKLVRRLRPHLAVAGPTTATAAAVHAGTPAVPVPAPTKPPLALRAPLPRCLAPPVHARRAPAQPIPQRPFPTRCLGPP